MLFVSHRNVDTDLSDVASGVFGALGVGDWEERHSSNYPPEDHYFAGYSEDAEVTVFDADDDVMPDYPIRVSIEPATWRQGFGKFPTDSMSVTAALVAAGFTVFVPASFERLSWDGEGEAYGPTKLVEPTGTSRVDSDVH